MSKLIFKNINYYQSDTGKTTCGDVFVEDGIIKKIGEVLEETDNETEVISGSEYLALPGFVNTHTHVAMSLLRDYGGDMPLSRWLNEYIWPAEAKLTDDDVFWGSQLGILEMLATGTTCFMEMYDHCDAIAEAVKKSGIRAILSRGSVGMFDSAKKGIQENDALFNAWHGAENDRIRVWYGPHAPNTCSGEYIQEMAQHSRERRTGIHIHVAETKAEVEKIIQEYGMTPAEWLASLGVLDVPTLAAHCVWMTEDDFDIFAKNHVAVAHNPVSNLKLASGIAPVASMQEKGIVVGLGTDGASSNNTLSMLRELQMAALIHKVRKYDAEEMGATQVINMATIEGAKALCLQNQIGSLEEGKKADITLFKMTQPWNIPHHDSVNNIAYAAQASDIEAVFVDGRCVYRQGEFLTLDKERIIFECQQIAKRIV